jgi:hypothetical protein
MAVNLIKCSKKVGVGGRDVLCVRLPKAEISIKVNTEKTNVFSEAYTTLIFC